VKLIIRLYIKPSTRQRFVSLSFEYPNPKLEQEIIVAETGVEDADAKRLVKIGNKIRNLTEMGLAETVSTRLLVDAGKLIHTGLGKRLAVDVAIVEPLTDDLDSLTALKEMTSMM